ncbi:MAG: phosphonopyruvate decarboxylase [Candidatus Methanomethylophilaceae archaeon]|nr:phosphonopyruvate decarboxylase [Candidatus Methanomethylophilaceae archaeon]
MQVESFVEALGSEFFVGVPDSQLRQLCDYLYDEYGIDERHHIIAANEGNCVGIAAGYHLATGKVPVVYMQNSGEGNIVNPVASLLNEAVYAIPCIFVVGWRGEPGVHDEPQHAFQGRITRELLDLLDIDHMVVDSSTDADDVRHALDLWKEPLSSGKQVAFVVRKGAFEYGNKVKYSNDCTIVREDAVGAIAKAADGGLIVSTTGKISRELYEYRDRNGQSHGSDFLTVGSMGHCSSIALGVAINRPDRKVWCIDGDGSALMHMGSLGVAASVAPRNMVHVVINNGSHETVGGMPTVSRTMDLVKVASACGYPKAVSVSDRGELDQVLEEARGSDVLTFVEIKCAIGSRKDLGRPKTSAIENKNSFMKTIGSM